MIDSIGPVGERVQANVRLLRKAHRLTTTALALRMGEAGRPIPSTGITRIEHGLRRVDVDDLVALASIFGVQPAFLLETRQECETCHGAPPPGFACKACATGADK